MANPQLLLSELKVDLCKETVVTRLFRFLEARNVKKSGELMEINMKIETVTAAELNAYVLNSGPKVHTLTYVLTA
ncbi:hypothetical protein YC2023_089738 [Brassica napus]